MEPLLHDVERAATARELKLCVMDGAPASFGAGAVGLYLFGAAGDVEEMHVRGVRDGFVLAYEQLGRDNDPILSRALATGVATHDGDVLGEAWPRSELYRACGGPWKIKHYLCAPIVVEGKLLGTINLGRRSEHHPFVADDVAKMSALTLRVGSRLAAFHAPSDDEFGRLRAARTHVRMHVDELERLGRPIEAERIGALWSSFAEGHVAPLDMFDRDDRTYVLLPAPDASAPPPAALTRRQADIAVRAAAGMPNKAIAFELGISPNTVGRTLLAARKKLGATSRVKLVEIVRRLGIT